MKGTAMTISKKFSKKLALIISLALSMQFTAHAFFADNIKNEKALILNFAQDIRQGNNTQAQAIAKWLDEQAISGSQYHSTIIDVITDKNLTENTKLTILCETMQREAKENRIHRINTFVNQVCEGILIAGSICFMGWLVIEAVKNPRPIVYTTPKPGVTITYRTTYWPYITLQ